ncbi:MAG: helix-turn-helix domain-containing protein [Oscillospiraceae bacterium]|nr:helix-turn-helix domain-containing protein [Oscillospiraceae bacterium]
MISENLAFLRRKAGLSQEALAEEIGVARQTLSKWESGESAPDLLHADALAAFFELSVDDLLHTELERVGKPPKGKMIFGTVTVGDKGQIVIPVKARRCFGIEPGDDLVVLGNIETGIALLKADFFLELAQKMQEEQS